MIVYWRDAEVSGYNSLENPIGRNMSGTLASTSPGRLQLIRNPIGIETVLVEPDQPVAELQLIRNPIGIEHSTLAGGPSGSAVTTH